jgi:type IV pilus assembly protein PilM
MKVQENRNKLGDWFFATFPPPRFLSFPDVGIDISDRSIKYVELVRRGKKLTIGKFGLKTLPPQAIDFGRIVDKDKVVDFLKKIKSETGFSLVRVSLPGERTSVFEVVVSSDNPVKDIEEYIKKETDFSVKDTIFDYEIFEKVSDQKSRAIVHSLPRKIVLDYVDVFKSAGMSPVLFETETQSIARSVINSSENGRSIVIDLGENTSSVSLVENKLLRFSSVIKTGSRGITGAISKNLSKTKEDAERIKVEEGLVGLKRYSAVFSEVEDIFSEIISETKRLLEKNEKTEIVLCGGGANLIGLTQYLSQKLGVSVKLADVWTNVLSVHSDVPKIFKGDSVRFASAIGLALKELIPKSLSILPVEEKRQSVKDYKLRLYFLCLILIGITVALSTIFILPSYTFVNSKREVIENHNQVTQKIAEIKSGGQVADLIERVNEKVSGLSTEEKPKLTNILATLTENIDSDIRITSITYQNDGGVFVGIHGISANIESTNELLSKLRKENILGEIDNPVLNFGSDGSVNFSVFTNIEKNRE